mgnify:CR=1 FL=1
MADELPPTGSIPENLADDVPSDVDFTAMMARSQAQLVLIGGMNYAANSDLEKKMAIFGGTPAEPAP